jgi:hypothetical protein
MLRNQLQQRESKICLKFVTITMSQPSSISIKVGLSKKQCLTSRRNSILWAFGWITPELKGSDPAPHKHGPANITWIIRWESMDARNEGHTTLFNSEEWKVIWANHPDANGYLQMEVKFAEEV